MPGVPSSAIYRLCRKGEVRVNGGRAKPSRRLVVGDEVRIPPVRLEAREQRRVPDQVIDQLEASVVYEDADLIVINKPTGLAVHRGSSQAFGVIEAMRQARSESGASLDLVHRLDRDTSGCLLLAKSACANRELKRLLAERSVQKTYNALVAGRWSKDIARIENSLSKNRMRGGERVTRSAEGGRKAVTEVLAVVTGRRCCLLDIRIETGRTHQIRVHTADTGHPIIGDGKYGDHRINRQFSNAGHRGMHLHSAEIALDWRGDRRFSVPYPESWNAALKL